MSPLSSSMSECTLQRYWSLFPNLPYSRSLISVVLNMITYHNLLVESSLQRCLGYFLFIISVTRIIQWTFLSSLKFDVFSSVAQSCLTLCDPMYCSMSGLPVHHQLPESTQTHVHRVCDTIQPSHPLSSPSPPAPNPSQHQGVFQWVNSSHEVAKVLEFQPQHQSFQWTARTDL